MAMALIRHRTSPGSGSGTGNSLISNVLIAVSMQAFMVFGIIPLDPPLIRYRVEKIMGMELTQTPLAVFFPQFESLWGIEEFSVIVSPGFIL